MTCCNRSKLELVKFCILLIKNLAWSFLSSFSDVNACFSAVVNQVTHFMVIYYLYIIRFITKESSWQFSLWCLLLRVSVVIDRVLNTCLLPEFHFLLRIIFSSSLTCSSLELLYLLCCSYHRKMLSAHHSIHGSVLISISSSFRLRGQAAYQTTTLIQAVSQEEKIFGNLTKLGS